MIWYMYMQCCRCVLQAIVKDANVERTEESDKLSLLLLQLSSPDVQEVALSSLLLALQSRSSFCLYENETWPVWLVYTQSLKQLHVHSTPSTVEPL